VQSDTATLTHARVYDGVCHAQGLFKSLSPGERDGSKLNVVYVPKSGDGPTLEFVGAEPLGIDDLRVFQGLIGAAAIRINGEWATVHHGSESDMGKALRNGLEKDLARRANDELVAQVDTAHAIVVRVSYARLAAEIGYSNTRDRSTIKDCIRRMFLVTIFTTMGGNTVGSRLLSQYEADDVRDEICIAINPTMAAAVLGTSHALRVNLTEARLLVSPAARLIHQRLSWINEGKSGNISMNKLCEYAYPPAGKDELNRRAGVEALKNAAKRKTLLIAATGPDAQAADVAKKKLAAIDLKCVQPTTDSAKIEKAREANTFNKHKKAVKAALAELVAMGWRVILNGKNMQISRPKSSAALELTATSA
jgi:hypothetical protein